MPMILSRRGTEKIINIALLYSLMASWEVDRYLEEDLT